MGALMEMPNLFGQYTAAITPSGPNFVNSYISGQQSAQQRASNALQQQQMRQALQNSQFGLAERGAIQQMAPQIAEQMRQSNMPGAQLYAQLAESGAPMMALDYMKGAGSVGMLNYNDKLRRQSAIANANQMVSDLYNTMLGAKAVINNGRSTKEQIATALDAYSNAFGEYDQVRQSIAQLNPTATEFAQVEIPAKVFADAEEKSQDREKFAWAAASASRSASKYPFEIRYLSAKTQEAIVNAQKAGREMQQFAYNDWTDFERQNAREIEAARDVILSLTKIREIKKMADKGNVPAQQAIVFLNSRAVTGPGVLTESDVANTSATSVIEQWAGKYKPDMGAASNYAKIYPNALQLLKSEYQVSKSSLQTKLDAFNNSRPNPSERKAMKDVLPIDQEALFNAGSDGSSGTSSRTGKVQMR